MTCLSLLEIRAAHGIVSALYLLEIKVQPPK